MTSAYGCSTACTARATTHVATAEQLYLHVHAAGKAAPMEPAVRGDARGDLRGAGGVAAAAARPDALAGRAACA